MSRPVLQSALPTAPWLNAPSWRLLGVQPQDPATWLFVDDAFFGQMAERDRLLAERPVQVHRILPEAAQAADECLSLVLEQVSGAEGYVRRDNQVVRPDGCRVRIDQANPLMTAGRLVQEDICIMQPGPHGHILTGAVLCFPASWTLAEKIGRPLVRIHAPVAEYDEALAPRVQRIFDGLQVGQPVWRANALLYVEPDLYSPRREGDGPRDAAVDGGYLRSERQVLMRFPKTGALIFAIHTSVMAVEDLTVEQRASLDRVRERSR